MTNTTKTNWSVVGMLAAWGLTLATFVWNAAVNQAQTVARLNVIEKNIDDLDSRLDIAESFRMEIRSDLAEIKTDLIWIRRQLDAATNP